MSAAPKEAICLDRYAGKDEARAARRLVAELLRCGYAVSVQDGEDWTVLRSTDSTTILEAMASTGFDVLLAQAPDPTAEKGWRKVGWFQLVYQHGAGDELIADCTANDECERICNHVGSVFE